MIGRRKRSRVVFIDGIPIESATLDAGESGVKNGDATIKPAALKELEPRALFDKYDADGSGGIDFDEFAVLLKDLQIILSEPKALAYFKRCDKMRRGQISFEEFRLALYTCDPKNPNRTMGFAPGQALSPKDLFEMYDREEQGAIDRATFMEVLTFLGHKLPLDQIEGIFATHEDTETEMMPYYQFKKAWLSLVDVRAELKNRHEKFNRFLTQAALMKKLELLINDEEKQETRMLLEASTTLDEERIAAYRRWLIDESVTLSKMVLGEAIDAAGQVYMFGKGPFGRLDGDLVNPDFVDFMDYEVVRDLYTARVRPNADALVHDLKVLAQANKDGGEEYDTDNKNDNTIKSGSSESESPVAHNSLAGDNSIPRGLTRAKTTLISAARAFSGRQVSLVPTFLWGKRVRRVAVGPAVAYALTDSGEVFCWGGSKRKWRYFDDTVTLDVGDFAEESIPGRPDAPSQVGHSNDRPLTPRTEILKQTMPERLEQQVEAHDQLYLRQKYQKTFVRPVRPLPTDDQKRRKLHLLGKYFDLLPGDIVPVDTSAPTRGTGKQKPNQAKDKKVTTAGTAPGLVSNNEGETTAPDISSSQSSAISPIPTYQTLLETIEPDLNVDDLVLALELRGVHLAKQTRLDLIDKLGDCLELELECLGPKFHAYMKEQDKAARRVKHDRLEKKMQSILGRNMLVWNELRILQEDIVRLSGDEFTKSERDYLEMKTRIIHAKQKIKRQAREGFHSDDSNSNSGLHLNGLTSRGAPQRFFDGDQAVFDIAVGSRHALAVHQTGKLLSWGVGSFGRLGGVRHEHGNATGTLSRVPQVDTDDDIDAWHRDIQSPQSLAALNHLRFRSVCCGFGHSLALTTDGDVYVWGSATHGKLGIGSVSSSAKESFTLSPLQLHLPGQRSTYRVRKIACGPSHSALITAEGALFVWGSGDGGKLGLGDGRDVGEDRVPRNGGQLGVVEIPVCVKALSKEHCVEVSCGTAHTVVLTAITANAVDGSWSGGRVFVAGSNHALGKFTPTFSLLHIPRVDDITSSEEADARSSTSVAITRVSCGNAHTALVSQDGELLTWGNNAGGCTGHLIVQPLIKVPTRVSCLYQYPRNLILENGVRASQSSQNASSLAEYALQNLSGSPQATGLTYSQTQQELCPFWQVKLVAMSRIERITVVVKLPPRSAATSLTTQRSENSTDQVTKPSTSLSSSSTSRSTHGSDGTKYVVMVSETPFDDERGKFSVAKAKSHSVFSSFTLASEDDGVWKWSLPVGTYGKHVRVHIENSVCMLSLIAVAVIGTRAEEFNGPRVSDVACAEGVTIAICRPLSAHETIRERFKRAVRVDCNNLWILQQLETFHPFIREEIEAKKTEGDDNVKPKCVLCRPKDKCVICLLDEATFAVEIQKEMARKQKEREDKNRDQLERERQREEDLIRQQKQLMRRAPVMAPNKSRESERRKSVRDAKAKADAEAKVKQQGLGSHVDDSDFEVLKRTFTLDEKCQKLLRTNMRTEEEEAEAEKRLAAELFAIDPVAAATQADKDKQNYNGASNQAGDGSATRTSMLDRLASMFKSRQRGSSAYAKPMVTE